MRILILNYYSPPMVDAHVYRWQQLARYWADQGHSVHVVAGRPLGAASEETVEGVRVSRRGVPRRQPPLGRPSGSAAEPGAAEAGTAALRRAATGALRRAYRAVYWPDAFWHWIPGALAAALRASRVRPELIVSYSPCFSAHVVAYLVRELTGNRAARWIADYGDPFGTSESMQPNNFAVYRRLNAAVERTLLGAASAVALTSEQTLRDYERAYAIGSKALLVPHLVDVDAFFAGPAAPEHEAAAAVTLTYIGGFHRGIREPDPLFTLAAALRHAGQPVIIDLFGPANGCVVGRPDVPEVRHHGVVAREDAIRLAAQAQVLVNVGNTGCTMVPSKIVEYIATGRPILDLSHPASRPACLLDYARLGHALCVDPERVATSGRAIAAFLAAARGRAAPLEDVRSVLATHQLPAIADLLLRAGLSPAGGE